jgi:hypothetical protein
MVGLAAALWLGVAAPARAEFSFDRFITQGKAAAGWIGEPNAPPGSTDRQSIRLFVNGSSSSDFDDAARAIFSGFEATPDPNPPGFDFKTSDAGASGGSVRLFIKFSDGGRGELRPLTLVADQWTHVGGTTAEWDTSGGSCGFQTQRTYAQVLACHAGATVTQMELVNDSGWLHPGGFQVLADNIAYAGRTISRPAPPVFGQDFIVTQLSGDVAVRVGQRSRAKIEGAANLPVGSFVDSQNGHVRLRTKRGRGQQTARFTDGIFQVKQSRKNKGLVDIRLSGDLSLCSASGSGAAAMTAKAKGEAARRRRRRRLWGRGRGRYRTRGRYSSGTVRGTKWLTEDRCDGTLTVVRQGIVEVRDFRLKKTIKLKAGKRYFAKKSG